MGLAILSPQLEDVTKTLNSVIRTILDANISMSIQENAISTHGRIDLEIRKKYIEEEYLSMDLIPKDEQDRSNQPGLLEIIYNEVNYYMIAGTADADCEHLIYDFSLSYLRLNPNHIISIYNQFFISLEIINEIETEKKYYNNWLKDLTQQS